MVESPRSSSRLEGVCDSFRLSAVIRDQEVECRRLPVAAGQRSLRRSTGPLRNLTLVGFVVSRALGSQGARGRRQGDADAPTE